MTASQLRPKHNFALLLAAANTLSFTVLASSLMPAVAQAPAKIITQPQARKFQSASARGAEPTTALAQARQMYRVHRYAEAADLFLRATKTDGAGAGGYLWVAHCHYAMGQTQQAVADYQHVIDVCRGTPESKVAAQYVARLDPQGKYQHSALSGHGSSSIITAVGGGGQSASLLDRIEIVRPVVGHPEVAASTITLVQDNIRQLPPEVQRLLQAGRVKFAITTTLIDKLPALGYQEGRGYDGYTYKSCPGMFSNNTVIICERFVDEATSEVQPPMSSTQITQNFYHEIGHAVDSCMGNFSTSEDYKHAYLLDIANIPADAASRLSYYMQKSLAGQQESCGEITGVCLGSCDRNSQDIKTYFPNTMALISKKLSADDWRNGSGGQIAGKNDGHHI